MSARAVVRLLPDEQRNDWEQTAVVRRSADMFLQTISSYSPLTPSRSFARDKGIPFHAYFAKVSKKRETPVRATMFTLGLTAVLSLFNLIPAVALSTLTSLSLTGLVSSYLLTVLSILSYRIRGQRLPASRFNLGKLQMYVKSAR